MNRRLFSLSAIAALIPFSFRSSLDSKPKKDEAQAEVNSWKAECLEALHGTDATSVGGLIAHQRAEIGSVADTLQEVAKERDELKAENERLMGAMYSAWFLIFDAYESVRVEGEADDGRPNRVKFARDWKGHADRWREDEWYPAQRRNKYMESNRLAAGIKDAAERGV